MGYTLVKIKTRLKICEKIGCQTEIKKKTSFKFQFEKLKKVKK